LKNIPGLRESFTLFPASGRDLFPDFFEVKPQGREPFFFKGFPLPQARMFCASSPLSQPEKSAV